MNQKSILHADTCHISNEIAEELLDIIAWEDKRERNHERRYYRHNVSLELMNEWYIHYTSYDAINDSKTMKELSKYLCFEDTIENFNLYYGIKTLADMDVSILQKRYEYQMTFKEIGKILHMKEDTVIKRHKRALNKLRKYVKNR